jgi:hypothetical protein
VDSGSEPIEDDELLYRRVPASGGWYDQTTGILKSEAFGPHKTQDISGLSVARAKHSSIEKAARGRPGKIYFVAVLRAGDLRQRGIDVVPRPDLPNGHRDPAHAELPGLNSAVRKTSQTLERQLILANELSLRVEGPFTTSGDESV